MEAFSDKEERFVARKLSGLLAQSHQTGKLVLRDGLVETQIVESLYEALLKHCHDTGMLPATVKRTELILYYSEVASNANYH